MNEFIGVTYRALRTQRYIKGPSLIHWALIPYGLVGIRIDTNLGSECYLVLSQERWLWLRQQATDKADLGKLASMGMLPFLLLRFAGLNKDWPTLGRHVENLNSILLQDGVTLPALKGLIPLQRGGRGTGQGHSGANMSNINNDTHIWKCNNETYCFNSNLKLITRNNPE